MRASTINSAPAAGPGSGFAQTIRSDMRTDTRAPAPIPEITTWRTPAVTQTNSPAWIMFTYASFGVAAFMTAVGVWALPGDLWMKGYMAMANVFLVGACFSLAKTQRDEHEAKRLANRIEDAKAEKLLMGIDR
jgi:hypothetical protein